MSRLTVPLLLLLTWASTSCTESESTPETVKSEFCAAVERLGEPFDAASSGDEDAAEEFVRLSLELEALERPAEIAEAYEALRDGTGSENGGVVDQEQYDRYNNASDRIDRYVLEECGIDLESGLAD